MPVSDKVSSSQEDVPPQVSDHPYQEFLAEQNAWELQLDADCAAKRASLHLAEQADVAEQKTSEADTDRTAKQARLHTDVIEKNASEPEMDQTAKRAKLQAGQPDVTLLRRQLEAKTEECQHLNSKLNQIESDTRVQEQLSEVCNLQSTNFAY